MFGDEIGFECVVSSIRIRRFERTKDDEMLQFTVFAGANALNCTPEVDRQGLVLAGFAARSSGENDDVDSLAEGAKAAFI